ncbi:hypothetical protein [Actinomadura nitritigenes]|uniref:hypothetical protein n=1 Tax=Actinomadura nitritigenes TaxID=134602 RepID=UPI003D9294F5
MTELDPGQVSWPALLTACCPAPKPVAVRNRWYCETCSATLTSPQFTALADCSHEQIIEIPGDGRSACPECGLLFCIASEPSDDVVFGPPERPCDNAAVTEDGKHCIDHAPARDVYAALDSITDMLEGANFLIAPAHYQTRKSQYAPLHSVEGGGDEYSAFAGHVSLQAHNGTEIREWRCDHRHESPETAAECAQAELLYQLGAAPAAYGYAACSILGLRQWTTTASATGDDVVQHEHWDNVMMRA